jgi:biotin synthase
VFSTGSVLRQIGGAVHSGKIRRVCIQALNYPKVFDDLCTFVEALKQQTDVPISVSCQPLNIGNMKRLADAGVDRIGIAVDAATEKIFDAIKGSAAGGPYRWFAQFRLLRKAAEFFGKGNVSTHLIIGLGETEKEAVSLVQECTDLEVLLALFAFTPIGGTALAATPQPSMEKYRRIQVARYLITNGIASADKMKFDAEGKIVDFGVSQKTLLRVVETGTPFLTSGCQDCNRPFYNEKPSGPLFNYPRKLMEDEISVIKQLLKLNYA